MPNPISSKVAFLDGTSIKFLQSTELPLEAKALQLWNLFTTVGVKIELTHKETKEIATFIVGPETFISMPELKETFDKSLASVMPFVIDYILRNIKPEITKYG